MIAITNTRTYRVRSKSGLTGWRCRLRQTYLRFGQFKAYSDCYGLAERLGYRNAHAAWRDNPVVEGSTNPSDYRRVS